MVSFDIKEAAEFLKVGVSTLTRKAKAGEVEVGQVWKYKDNTYVVTGIERIKGKTKIGDEWIEGLELIHYHRGTDLISIEFQSYTRTLEGFLAKFNRVGYE